MPPIGTFILPIETHPVLAKVSPCPTEHVDALLTHLLSPPTPPPAMASTPDERFSADDMSEHSHDEAGYESTTEDAAPVFACPPAPRATTPIRAAVRASPAPSPSGSNKPATKDLKGKGKAVIDAPHIDLRDHMVPPAAAAAAAVVPNKPKKEVVKKTVAIQAVQPRSFSPDDLAKFNRACQAFLEKETFPLYDHLDFKEPAFKTAKREATTNTVSFFVKPTNVKKGFHADFSPAWWSTKNMTVSTTERPSTGLERIKAIPFYDHDAGDIKVYFHLEAEEAVARDGLGIDGKIQWSTYQQANQVHYNECVMSDKLAFGKSNKNFLNPAGGPGTLKALYLESTKKITPPEKPVDSRKVPATKTKPVGSPAAKPATKPAAPVAKPPSTVAAMDTTNDNDVPPAKKTTVLSLANHDEAATKKRKPETDARKRTKIFIAEDDEDDEEDEEDEDEEGEDEEADTDDVPRPMATKSKSRYGQVYIKSIIVPKQPIVFEGVWTIANMQTNPINNKPQLVLQLD